MDCWKKYTASELEESIRNDPLTQEKVKKTIKSKIVQIEFAGKLPSSVILPSGDRKYSVFIRENDNMDEQKIRLIHALNHAYREVSVFSDRESGADCGIEELIDAEARKFYSENKGFVDGLYETLRKK